MGLGGERLVAVLNPNTLELPMMIERKATSCRTPDFMVMALTLIVEIFFEFVS